MNDNTKKKRTNQKKPPNRMKLAILRIGIHILLLWIKVTIAAFYYLYPVNTSSRRKRQRILKCTLFGTIGIIVVIMMSHYLRIYLNTLDEFCLAYIWMGIEFIHQEVQVLLQMSAEIRKGNNTAHL